MKKILFLLFIFALSACDKSIMQETPAPIEEPIKKEKIAEEIIMRETSYSANEENVKIIGRTHFDNDVLWCVQSGSGAEFIYTPVQASQIIITIVSDGSHNGNVINMARIEIYAGDERIVDDMIDETEKNYTLDLHAETQIKIIKLSEAQNSSFGIKNIDIESNSYISPALEKPLLIEFIGDSITCGYGVDAEDKSDSFSTATEDFTKTYAYKTAQNLGADYSILAFSGWGIISGYTGNKEKNTAQILPPYYKKIGLNRFNIEWDFNKRQPDIIVINLGTNDDSYCKNEPEKREEFSKAYTQFLTEVRALNPDARIICAFGIMGDKLFPYIEKAVNNSGDDNISCLKFDVQIGDDGYGADWHPSEVTHEKAAQNLIGYIKA